MNCLCFIISPCELILVLLIVNLHSMIYVELVMLTYIHVLYISMSLLGLESCIPYALGHPRILGVSA